MGSWRCGRGVAQPEVRHVTELADFLRACYLEIRQQAVAATTYASATWTTPFSATLDTGDDTINLGDREVAAHVILHDPAHVIADIDAKLAVLDHYAKLVHYAEVGRHLEYDLAEGAASVTLKLLAAPYREHPDYKVEWAPSM
jgi:hypothetical protein